MPDAESGRRRPSSRPWFRLGMTLPLGASCLGAGVDETKPNADGPGLSRVRRPTALAMGKDGSRLFVANGRSGSLSVIETSSARVVAEHDLGRGLADLAVLTDGRHLLAVDRAGDALLLVELGEGGRG